MDLRPVLTYIHVAATGAFALATAHQAKPCKRLVACRGTVSRAPVDRREIGSIALQVSLLLVAALIIGSTLIHGSQLTTSCTARLALSTAVGCLIFIISTLTVIPSAVRASYALASFSTWMALYLLDPMGTHQLLLIPILILSFTGVLLEVVTPYRPLPNETYRHPLTECDFISRLMVNWLNPLLYKATTEGLSEHSPFPIDEKLSVRSAVDLAPGIPSQRQPYPDNLIRLLFQQSSQPLLASAALALTDACITTLIPFLFRRLLTQRDLISVSYLAACGVFSAICASQSLYYLRLTTMRFKIIMNAEVCKKTLTISSRERIEGLEPPVLIDIDTANVGKMIEVLHDFWIAPLLACGSTIALIYLLGWKSMLAGLIPALIIMPILLRTISAVYTGMIQVMQAKDARVRLVTEVLSRIRAVKLYCWWDLFERKIDDRRAVELDAMSKIAMKNALVVFLSVVYPYMLASAAFGTFVALGGQLSSELLFPALAFFTIFSRACMMMPNLVMMYQGSSISYGRMLRYLRLPSSTFYSNEVTANEQPFISTTQASFNSIASDGTLSDKPLLTGCNMYAVAGELIVINGPLGSGKTTLIRALFGQVQPSHGAVLVHGKVAFASQKPFLARSTIRENILFGQSLDTHWYNQVLEACALQTDLQRLPDGDATMLGGTGTTLSGGQCSRIALARAVYSKHSVVVLDDPLAAVDANTQSKLVRRLFGSSGLLSERVCVVVSASETLTSMADRVYTIFDGTVVEAKHDKAARKTSAMTCVPSDQATNTSISAITVETPELNCGSGSHPELASVEANFATETTTLLQKPVTVAATSVSREAVSREDILSFLSSAKPWGWLLVLLSAFSAKSVGVISVYFLKLCSQATNITDTAIDIACFLLFGVVSAGLLIFMVIAAYLLCLIPANRAIHNRLTKGVLRSKFSFFDTVPLGQILNRFTNDIDKIDSPVAGGILKLTTVGTSLITTLSVLVVMLPLSVVYLIPLSAIYIATQRYYIHACRQLRRIENEARGQIIGAVNEAQEGRNVIRSFGKEALFNSRAFTAIDNHLRVWSNWECLDVWLSIRLRLQGCAIQVLSAALLIAVNASPGTTGLVMNYMLQLTLEMVPFIQTLANLDADLSSVERVRVYEKNPIEGADLEDGREPLSVPASWPAEPRITFHNYTARHRAGTPACLRGINISIQPGERVAVVGRTGAGKSSLVLALMGALERMPDASGYGRLEIDGLDTSKLRLQDLRSCMAIIPQEVSAFTGTLKENLDPLGLHSDEELLDVIQQCGIVKVLGITYESNPLTYFVVDGGRNLSTGQTQLLTIARAILTNRKILILDEATAAIDAESDNLVQGIIRKSFKGKTIITIAHKIQTILDYDRILVMDQGQSIEFDTPGNLLAKPESAFAKLVKEGGLENRVSSRNKEEE